MTNRNDLSSEVRKEIQNAIWESEEMNEEKYRQEIEQNSQELDVMRKMIFRKSSSITDENLKIYLNQYFERAKQSTAGVYALFVNKLSIVLYELRQHNVNEFQDFANKFGNFKS